VADRGDQQGGVAVVEAGDGVAEVDGDADGETGRQLEGGDREASDRGA